MKFSEYVLNKSHSYTYYKNKMTTLSNENKNLLNENKKLKTQLNESKKQLKEYYNQLAKLNENYLNLINLIDNNFEEINSKFNSMNSEFNNKNNKNYLINKEIQYALIFNDTIKDSNWVKSKNFSLNNGAANYSFMYDLFRILDEVKPENILELGLGQTTKLTSQYANFFNDTKLTVIDGDENWINNFSENLIIGDNIKIILSELEKFTFRNTENLRYKNFNNIIKDEKFDLIVIDGPQGFFSPGFRMLDYSRSNVWDLIPDNIADNFVIIIDDYERKGEKNTISIVKELLSENKIDYYTFNSIGLKEQYVIASEEYKFISWY